MPRAVLTFRLPAERVEFEHAAHADDWYLLVWEVLEGQARDLAAGKIRDWLCDEIERRGLQLEE